MINTVWGNTKKPAASKVLSDLLASMHDWPGTLYIGYPIIGSPEGAYPFDAVLVSPKFGLIIFDVVEGKLVDAFDARQDESYTKLQAKLLQHSQLINKKHLQVQLNVITFAPALNLNKIQQVNSQDYIVANSDTLLDIVGSFDDWKANHLFSELSSAIQAISSIRKGRKRRDLINPDSRGSKIKSLEDTIATLDNQQSEAVIETVEGVQRIRGLAGSGKTIVLALKVAYLHAQQRDWKIAVTFNTRSLKGQFQRLINTFVIEQSNEEPDWSRIEIINAWGGSGIDKDGVYRKFCLENGLQFYDFKAAENAFGTPKAFEGACQRALDECKSPKQIYDVILVDEAQDFSPSFLRLCYEFLKEPKRLVYAYDELQSLTDNSLPSPEEIFGKNTDGSNKVRFEPYVKGIPKQDIILEKCYRNSRPILTTAHGLGFGIYRNPEGLVQIFEQNKLWLDVGYEIEKGELEDGKQVSLMRTEETSPKFLEDHSSIEDIVTFKSFSSASEQTDWLVAEIVKNIREEELRPEDIVVINPDPLKTRDAVSIARAKLFDLDINSELAGVSNSPDIFFQNDSITFTGIFRAKGNEAAMVYIINAQDCCSSIFPSELAKARSRLFTAITRSKAWVRVLGVGRGMEKLIEEFNQIREHNFKLEFIYPTPEQKQKLKVINRDMTSAEKTKLKKRLGSMSELIESLDAGELTVEDMPVEIRDKLLIHLQKMIKK